MRWRPIVGDHWIYTNTSDWSDRISPASSGPEAITRRSMMQDAQQWIGYGWRVVSSARDRIILEWAPGTTRTAEAVGYPAARERRTLSIRQCSGPPVCTSCQAVRDESKDRIQRLFNQAVRGVRRSYAGPRRRRPRRG